MKMKELYSTISQKASKSIEKENTVFGSVEDLLDEK